MRATTQIRKRLDLTQAALAKGIGVTQSNVSHYENGGQTVPPDVAARLITFASTLGVTLTFDDIYAADSDEPTVATPTPTGSADAWPPGGATSAIACGREEPRLADPTPGEAPHA